MLEKDPLMHLRNPSSRDEISEFVSLVSHTLKNSLYAINIHANLLLARYGPALDEEGRAKIGTLLRAGDDMRRQLDALSQYSRACSAATATHETCLATLIEEELAELRPQLSGQHVRISIPQSLPVVNCDPDAVRTLYGQLIRNALQYHDKPEKQVEIGFTCDPGGSPARPAATAPDVPVFYVRDNGIGIAPRDFETIFQIFKRLHRHDAYGGGVGAGLAIARRIVENHGGQIWVESTPGQGTTFYFTLQSEY